MRKPPKPAGLLDETATIESPKDASTAMAELAWMDATENLINGAVAAEVTKAKNAAESRLKIGMESFAARRKLLTDNLKSFARTAKAVLLSGGRKGAKTAKMTHGEIGFKEQVERIEVDDSVAFKKLTDGLEKTLSEKLAHKGQHVVWNVFTDEDTGEDIEEKVCVASLVTVKVTLDKAGALACWRNGLLTEEQFRLFGLKRDKPDEKISVKINPEAIISQSDAA